MNETSLNHEILFKGFGTHRSSTTSRTFQGEKSVHGPSQVSNLHFALLCYFCEVLTRLQYLDLLLRCLEKVPKICSQMVVKNGDLSKKSTLNKSKRRPWECFSHEIVRYLCCCPSHVHPPSKSAKNLSRITGNRTSSRGMMNLKCFQNDTPLKINGLNIQTYIHILYIQTHINRPNPKFFFHGSTTAIVGCQYLTVGCYPFTSDCACQLLTMPHRSEQKNGSLEELGSKVVSTHP